MSFVRLWRAGRRATVAVALLAVAAILAVALPARSAAVPPGQVAGGPGAVSQAPGRLLPVSTERSAAPHRVAEVETTDAVDEGDLPTTGTKIGVFVGLGALVLVAGVALLVFARRREDSDIE